MNSRLCFLSLAIFLFVVLAGCAYTPATPAAVPAGLSIEEHALTQRPEAEYTQLYFAEGSQESILAKHAQERASLITIMDHACMVATHFGQCVSFGTDQLAAWADDPNDPLASVSVTVTRDGGPIYKIPVGNSSPIGSIRGLWMYADHWALETAFVTNHQRGNEISSEVVGQISVDSQLLNKQLKYQEAFGFQILHGKPFYFFKKGNKIGISYDGVEVPARRR